MVESGRLAPSFDSLTILSIKFFLFIDYPCSMLDYEHRDTKRY